MIARGAKPAPPSPVRALFHRWFDRTGARDGNVPSLFGAFRAGFLAGRRFQRLKGD